MAKKKLWDFFVEEVSALSPSIRASSLAFPRRITFTFSDFGNIDTDISFSERSEFQLPSGNTKSLRVVRQKDDWSLIVEYPRDEDLNSCIAWLGSTFGVFMAQWARHAVLADARREALSQRDKACANKRELERCSLELT